MCGSTAGSATAPSVTNTPPSSSVPGVPASGRGPPWLTLASAPVAPVAPVVPFAPVVPGPPFVELAPLVEPPFVEPPFVESPPFEVLLFEVLEDSVPPDAPPLEPEPFVEPEPPPHATNVAAERRRKMFEEKKGEGDEKRIDRTEDLSTGGAPLHDETEERRFLHGGSP
jgi:hypothetical protein